MTEVLTRVDAVTKQPSSVLIFLVYQRVAMVSNHEGSHRA